MAKQKNIPESSAFQIENAETLKVISHPLRLQIIERVNLAGKSGELITVKEIAVAVGKQPQKLYYHINLLEKFGLIRVVKTRIVSGIIEKHYAPTARHIRVSPHLFDSGVIPDEESQAVLQLLDSAVEEVRQDFTAVLERAGTAAENPVRFNGRRAHLTQERMLLTPEQAQQFQARLLALTEAFSNLAPSDSDSEVAFYNLMTAFVPAEQTGSQLQTAEEK